MLSDYGERMGKFKKLFGEAEKIVIGGGAGLSSAAGLTYAGKRFTDNFSDFIEKYGMTDMYSAGFYPFATPEEKWAYWSRHICLNRWDPPAADLYKKLYSLVKDRDYFVITTNVDGQFEKAGFDAQRIFAVQGDYGKLQCSRGCHDRLYDDEKLVREMVAEQRDCRIPSHLLPKCPVCGEDMEVHVRKDPYFVQNKEWYGAERRYDDFMRGCEGKQTLLIELGVGYNTPTIIRFPFEQRAAEHKECTLCRINREDCRALFDLGGRYICFDEPIGKILSEIR